MKTVKQKSVGTHVSVCVQPPFVVGIKSMNKSVAPVRSDIIDLAHMLNCGVSFLVITDSISGTTKCQDLLQYINRVEYALNCETINL